jgi:predicted membrane GTPase involved in stress response
VNVLERKMFVQKFQAGGDARLPITVIIEERKKRGLPVSLNDPEVVAQAEALQRGLPVSEIFQDQPFDIRYQANVQSMIDRGVPAQEIQAQFAQMGLPISLYQIQQMGGVSAPTVTQPRRS